MNCKEIEERDILDAYLLDRLEAPTRDEFEKHYFECDSCFSRLQVGLATQEVLRSQPQMRAQAGGAFLRRIWAWTPALATLVLLFAVGLWWRLAEKRSQRPAAALSQPQRDLSPQSKPPAPASPSLEELAKVEPPPYSVVVLRGTDDEIEETFHKAMEYYLKGNYARAIPGLRTAAQASPQNPKFSFYLAACYLLTDQTELAIEFFRKTVSLGDSAYSEQAHFYLAKAYLRKRQVSEAKAELQETVWVGGSRQNDAEEILRHLPE